MLQFWRADPVCINPQRCLLALPVEQDKTQRPCPGLMLQVCSDFDLLCVIQTFLEHMVQVLKGRLSVHQPTVMCDGFVYEEGEDLDEEELQTNAANLPKTLQSLPGTHAL